MSGEGRAAGARGTLPVEIERGGNGQPDSAAALAKAAELLAADDSLGARTVLVAYRRALQDDRERTARNEAGLAAEEARIATLEGRFRSAASLYRNAAELTAFDPFAAWDYLRKACDALRTQDERFGDKTALSEVVALHDLALHGEARAIVSRDRDTRLWTRLQSDLGDALVALGERGNGVEHLERAVAAYRAALEIEWLDDRAEIETRLDDALAMLGEEEEEEEEEEDAEEAVAACRAAIEACSRDDDPLDWAETQTNLGNALLRLGEQECGALIRLGERDSGTERLEEAVVAYRAALEEYTRDRAPLDWAITQNNLGLALMRLGERGSGTERLEEAVAAHRAALDACSRDDDPLDWAWIQNDLGLALSRLGERGGGVAAWEAAVAAFRAAQEEFTRESHPNQWRRLRNEIHTAFSMLDMMDGKAWTRRNSVPRRMKRASGAS